MTTKAVQKTTEPSKHKLRRVESDFITLEIGESVEGFIHKENTITFPGKNGNPPSVVGKYAFTDDAGKTRSILGGAKLDQLLEEIQDGTWVLITRTESKTTSSGNKMKDYTLDVEAS